MTGLVAGGGTGVDDVGAWGRGQQRGWEAAGLAGRAQRWGTGTPGRPTCARLPPPPSACPTLSCRMR